MGLIVATVRPPAPQSWHPVAPLLARGSCPPAWIRPTARRTSSQSPAEIGKTTVRRFPLVHQLIHFADLRNFYREMREALISANRRACAQQGLVTKAKIKIAQLEAVQRQEREHAAEAPGPAAVPSLPYPPEANRIELRQPGGAEGLQRMGIEAGAAGHGGLGR